MPKIIKYLVIALAALLGLLLVVAGVVAATFNPNDYKPLVIRLVQEKKQRTLQIPGDIKLTFFPKIGADLGQVRLSEHNNAAEFASIKSAKVSLELFPLLSKRLVVDRIKIDGISANLKRFKDGTTNLDDLLSKQESGQQIKFNVDSVSVTDAHIQFDDQQLGRTLELTHLKLETGRIASGVFSDLDLSAVIKGNKPQLEAKIWVKSGFMFDLEQKYGALKGLDAQLQGNLADIAGVDFKLSGDADLRPGGKLSGQAKLTQGARNVTAAFSVSSYDGTLQAFKIPALTLDVAIKDAALDASAKLSGALHGDTGKQLFSMSKLSLTLDAKQGAGSTAQKLKADGSAHLDLDKQSLALLLKGSLDESSFDARLGLTKFTPATYTFDVTIDRFDADRYRTQSAAATAPVPAGAADKRPMDLSALRDVNASGNLKIGAFKAANVKAANVRLALHAANGKIDVNPFAAELYGGSASGAASVQASSPPHFSLRQNLAGINIGPLLKDAIDQNHLEGKGNVLLDISTHGGSADQMKQNLNGSARLELRDGTLRGINVGQTIRAAKAKIDAVKGGSPAQAGTASSAEKTDFSEMAGNFRIANGVAHNDDLSVKSPLLRLAGAGDINLAEGRLDYLIKAAVVSTLQGQGGAELQALKGVTIPVKLSGPFTAIAWNIDFAGMVGELAKQKVDEKKEEVKAKAQQALDEQKNKLQDQLKDKLKGLFGK